jgi:hypothetical protein
LADEPTWFECVNLSQGVSANRVERNRLGVSTKENMRRAIKWAVMGRMERANAERQARTLGSDAPSMES